MKWAVKIICLILSKTSEKNKRGVFYLVELTFELKYLIAYVIL